MRTAHNNTLRDSSYSSIGEVLLHTIENYPEKRALIHSEKSWTYCQLGSIISAGMRELKTHLGDNGQRIAIIGNNHPAYVAGYFSAQCLGVPTVEVGRHESLDTLMGIVSQTNGGFVLTDRDDLIAALQGDIPTESFADFFSTCEGSSSNGVRLDLSDRVIDGDRIASFIYTSGTTGFPKGVMLTQANFSFVVSSVVEYLRLCHEDRYALVLPLSHTYGKTVMLTSVAVGASLVLMESLQNLKQFVDQLVETRCTILSVVPYHAHVLLKWGNLADRDLSSLRAITSSGNKLPSETIDHLTSVLPSVKIFLMYGLTETTTRACYLPPELLSKKKESCGKPLRGVECRIMGDGGTALSAGEVGEVVLRGPNIMQGYFNDQELTAKTLVDGWLWTGDIGYLDEEGFLYLVGRKKEIIKCAGERISPVEVEEVLMKHPGVAEVAVKGSPDVLLGEVVHAYVVRSGSLEERDLRAFCAKRLSHHKMPRRYSFIENLRKTATGKVRKHLLEER